MVKEPIKYTGEPCENCQRHRVELYDNGEMICEKCGWNKTTKEYENLDELADLAFEEKYPRMEDGE